MTTLAAVILIWLIAVWGFSKLTFVNPRGWLELANYMLGFFVWATGFFIIVWLTPIPWW